MRKLLFAFILYTLYLILYTPPVSAHFVKSNAGIGAVLHVDPGDEPVAREPSNIILEFKDTSSKFDLSNCECKIVVTGNDQEITNQNLGPVAPDQKLSSVTPITFPEKNIYKLKITGRSKENLYPSFELDYDIRVAKDSNAAAVTDEPKPWWSTHLIHLIGGVVIATFLIVALIGQSKKIAVIILVLLLLGHSIPIKVIHASHNGSVNNSEFACCLPSFAVIPETVEIIDKLPKFTEKPIQEILSSKSQILNLLTIRPPPSIS